MKLSTAVLRTQPDEKLSALAAEGSTAAFEAIVHRYRRGLQSYCRRLLLSDHRSEDVVQQALINAWSAFQRGTEVRELRAWLYRITHNQAMVALRRPELGYSDITDALRGADAPHAELDRRMVMRETLAAVAALPERQRNAILRTAVDGQTYEEVAAAMGLTDDAVRGLIHRARCSLRAGLAVIAPTPVVLWAAAQSRRAGPWPQLIGEMAAGGGAAGGATALLKSAAVIATSAAVIGGTVARVADAPSATVTPHGGHAPVSLHTPTAHKRVATPSRVATASSAPATTAPVAAVATVAAVSTRWTAPSHPESAVLRVAGAPAGAASGRETGSGHETASRRAWRSGATGQGDRHNSQSGGWTNGGRATPQASPVHDQRQPDGGWEGSKQANAPQATSASPPAAAGPPATMAAAPSSQPPNGARAATGGPMSGSGAGG